MLSRNPLIEEIQTTEMYRDGIAVWYWTRVSKAKERENEEITGSKDICWATYLALDWRRTHARGTVIFVRFPGTVRT